MHETLPPKLSFIRVCSKLDTVAYNLTMIESKLAGSRSAQTVAAWLGGSRTTDSTHYTQDRTLSFDLALSIFTTLAK